MAKDMKISNAAAIVMCDVYCDLADAGASFGLIKIYSAGSGIPADVDTAISDQTLLATLTCSDPAFGGAVDVSPGARATADTITSETSATAGTAAFFRATDSNGLAFDQGTCGTSDSDMIMNTTIIAAGATVACTSWTVTMPEG